MISNCNYKLKLLLGLLFNYFFRFKVTSKAFPEIIDGKYFFSKKFSLGEKRPFKYAIYKDKKNKKYFAKIYSGSIFSFHSITLKNEVNFYKWFSTIRNNNKSVKIPRFYFYSENKNGCILLTEYIKAKPLHKFSHRTKIIVYEKVLLFLNGLRVNNDYKSNLPLYISSLFMIIFLKFVSPKKIPFIKLVKVLFSSFSIRIHLANNIFLHRSLEPKNILVSNKKIFLIDFQFATFGNEYSEIAHLLYFSASSYKKFKSLTILPSILKVISSHNQRKYLNLNLLYVSLEELLFGDQAFNNSKIIFNYLINQL